MHNMDEIAIPDNLEFVGK